MMTRHFRTLISLAQLAAIALLLSACSVLPRSPSQNAVDHSALYPPVTMSVVNLQDDSHAIEHATRPFAAETLYSLLVAEIAGQRQRYDVALYHYLKQAQQTRDPGVAERSTRIAQYVGSQPHANEAVALWLELEPDNPRAHQAAAHIAMEQGQLTLAAYHTEQLWLLTGINQFDVLAANAERHSRVEQERLLVELIELDDRHPKQVQIKFALALISQQLEQYTDALAYIQQALKLDSSAAHISLHEVRVLILMQEIEQAEKKIIALKRRFPEHKGIQVMHARLLLDQRRLTDARNAFAALYQQFPDDDAILFSLALLEYEVGDSQQAYDYLRLLNDSRHHQNEANFYLGNIAYDNEQWQHALHYYRLVRPSREFLPAHMRAAQLIRRLQSVSDAQSYLHEQQVQFPQQRSELQRLEVDLLIQAEQHSTVFLLLSELIEQDEYDIDLRYLRAIVAERLDDLTTVEQDLLWILQRHPQHVESLNALGYTLANRTDRLDEAKTYIIAAYELAPNNPAIMDSLGWLYYRMNDYERARPLLSNAFTQLPDHEIAAHYGELLWQLGETERAYEVWRTGLEQTPNSPVILETLERLNTDITP